MDAVAGADLVADGLEEEILNRGDKPGQRQCVAKAQNTVWRQLLQCNGLRSAAGGAEAETIAASLCNFASCPSRERREEHTAVLAKWTAR